MMFIRGTEYYTITIISDNVHTEQSLKSGMNRECIWKL